MDRHRPDPHGTPSRHQPEQLVAPEILALDDGASFREVYRGNPVGPGLGRKMSVFTGPSVASGLPRRLSNVYSHRGHTQRSCPEETAMNFRRALESAADRMLGRIVPRATASADQYECSTQHRCTFKLGCWVSHGLDTYQTRTYCSDGSSTSWKDLGCC